MNKFKGYYIPDGIKFYFFVDEYLAGNNQNDCGSITNGGLDVDYYGGVSKKNKNCKNVLCAKCIFSNLNLKQRLEYFKEMKESK